MKKTILSILAAIGIGTASCSAEGHLEGAKQLDYLNAEAFDAGVKSLDKANTYYVYCRELETPVGEVILGAIGGELCLCDWKNSKIRMQNANRIKRLLTAELVDITSVQEKPGLLAEASALQDSFSVLDKTERELAEYFAGSRQSFDVPLLLAGTDFQKSVWQALRQIPYGEVVTYMDVSRAIGNPQAIRAVSQAIGSNPLSILIPCHRVVGGNGSLTGYAGGIEAKRCLLELEEKTNRLLKVW